MDTIWHTKKNNFLPLSWWKWKWKEPIKYILNWYGFRSKMQNSSIGMEMARQTRMRDFAEHYIHYRYDIKNIQMLSKQKYDAFFIGSDQVWNPTAVLDSTTFLEMAPEGKRFSYAASISAPEIPEDKKDFFVRGLNGMTTLSLREQAGADLVEKLTGRKAEVHIDPTMLLTAEEWRAISRPPTWYKGGKYILTYFLGERPDVVDKVAENLKLPVINLMDPSVYDTYVTGVDEFLWAIDHAELVYTDSFHGTVFSILFHRPFVICNRVGNSITEAMGSRIDSLLQAFGFEERRGTKENGYLISNPLDNPDWSRVEPVLQRERGRSAAYFERILHRKAGKE